MAVYVSNVTIPCGADFEQIFNLEEASGIPLDLTNYTGTSELKKHPLSLKKTATFTVSFVGSRTEGKVQISLASSVTSQIRPGRYSYDILLNSGTSIIRVVEGSALVTAGVTTTRP
jgi:hypothetical protein